MAQIKLSESKVIKIKEICKSFNNDSTDLINVLRKVQSEFGYLPAEVQEAVAKELKIPVAQVYGVVSFFSAFTMLPKGEFPISICLGTACFVRGGENVLNEFKKILNINIGETSSDGKFSINCLRCVGACSMAPVVMVGEKMYGSVTPDKVKEIVEEYQ